MILKHTYLAAASALIMTSLMGAPSFAADGCETDPDWECIEIPDIFLLDNLELPDPHIRELEQEGHIGVLGKGGEIARPTKIIVPKPIDGSPRIQDLPTE